MSLFGSKKNKETTEKKEIKVEKKTRSVTKKTVKKNLEVSKSKPKVKKTDTFASVLVRPRITEKATTEAEKGVYVFEVRTNATKKEIGGAVMHYYNVTPVKVNIVKIPEKIVFSRAKRQKGVKSGGKKAYVYLKKGDKIEIV